ncbi:hypothetical protein [Bdellovibrio sp. NC01]|uniref:hypothetical protein n=1 Tax=Bdellovibrio sp. NC01 TaxID=2220073 RepID=UPI00143D1731|nr:hypothetical protein [Bdellovibrio sp. NC01]
MSGHHKNKGFSQTSKRYEGSLKAQRKASHNKQLDHSSDVHEEEAGQSSSNKNTANK